MDKLPIDAVLPELEETLVAHTAAVLVAEPGGQDDAGAAGA